MRSLLALLLVTAVTGTAAIASADVTVFLNRGGHIDAETGATIPAFGGGDRVWAATTACVKAHYAPFRVDIVDHRPTTGTYITAVVGGKASLLGGDDRTTNGVGPYSGSVIPDAVVYVFSQVGTGERDVENLCSVTAHEVAHALGLDHTYYCGDIMSYFLDRCGARRFIDVDAPCGEDGERTCGSGAATQNSYQRLAALVGLRSQPAPAPVEDAIDDVDDPVADPAGDADGEDGEDGEDADATAEDVDATEVDEDADATAEDADVDVAEDADQPAIVAPPVAPGPRCGEHGWHHRGGQARLSKYWR
ncbi:MAG: matrixin family metalloprotease [Proteobacteria bacterium]|nr:matrixin family metalloprotease [Pseudomonadota bacterium]